jgi:hypothetical protein
VEGGEFDGGEALAQEFGGVVGSFVGCGLCVGEVVFEEVEVGDDCGLEPVALVAGVAFGVADVVAAAESSAGAADEGVGGAGAGGFAPPEVVADLVEAGGSLWVQR